MFCTHVYCTLISAHVYFHWCSFGFVTSRTMAFTGSCFWLGQPAKDIIKYAVKLCSPVLQIDNECKQVTKCPYGVSLAELKQTALGQSLDEADCLSNVLSRIYLSLQRNKLIHSLVLPSCTIVACQYGTNKKIEYSKYL